MPQRSSRDIVLFVVHLVSEARSLLISATELYIQASGQLSCFLSDRGNLELSQGEYLKPVQP